MAVIIGNMENWNKKLIEAAEKGRVEELRLCLANGANIDSQKDDGLTALMVAARVGHVEVCQLLLENRCNKDITDDRGWTALMMAASKGHVEHSTGWTALMLAAIWGHVEVCQLLLENRCNKDITSSDGQTALHLAAKWGRLQTTRYLVEQASISPLVKTHQGKTPYDLATENKYGQNKEVMEYLQTAVLRMKDNKVPTEIELMADKRSVPLYLKLLESGSEKKRDIRLVIVGKKGAGKTSLVNRLFKEGKKTGGPSSFLKRLFGRNNADVTSTNGIEIHVIKCKAKFGDSIWNKLEGNYKATELNARLLKPYEETLTNKHSLASIEKAAHNTFNDNTSPTGFEESKVPLSTSQPSKLKHPVDTECKEQTQVDSQIERLVATACTEDTQVKHSDRAQETVKDNTCITILYRRVDESNDSTFFSQQHEKMKPPVVTQVEPPVTTKSKITNTDHRQEQNLLLSKAYKDIKAMMDKSKVDLHDKEEYVNFLLWDFAGDEEFYHTHQTFLSQDAIYLVVTKLNEANDKNAQDMFQLWMNSIHCYCRLDDQQNKPERVTPTMDDSMEKEETNMCDPPVILVGSHKDKVRNSKGETIEIECKKQIESFVKGVSDDACGHIRSEYFISNTKDDDCEFKKIKQDILNLARGMKSWNKTYPLKFTQLEKSLQEKMTVLQIPIITFNELMSISLETPMPMNDEELVLFLKFQHELRAIVYFEDLPDFIILDTQWLSDAFKCIVTAEKFQFDVSRHKMKDKLEDLNVRGILHTEVLDDIFKDKRNVLYKHEKHKDDILNIMEKFDIIIPATGESADEKPCFYVPCMVKSKPENDIYEMFNVTKDTCKKSTWLCFKFRFLPPHLINHLIASLSRKYKIAVVDTPEQEKSEIALFRGIAVFELEETIKLRKLLLRTCPNLIQIQVLEFRKEIKTGMYKHIASFVTEEIDKIISRRFKMSNVKFEKRWKCDLKNPDSVTGLIDFSAEQDKVYYCEACTTTHEFNNEWSDLEVRTSCLSQSSEQIPSLNLYPEISGQIQRTGTSTKVRVHVQAGDRVFSNVNQEATSTASFSGFTKEEINFTKMGMIVLNILADASYDLLKPDKPNLRPRSDCDITHLYSEHRKLNKHIPSNLWGGTWQTIQNTDIAIGDDIERIRLTRNELQHSRIFKLEDKRFIELCNILSDLLKRFDLHNTPTRLYTDALNDILAKTISAEEVKSIENDIHVLGMRIEVEIEH
ncbi:uncharacterized protein LOC134690160 [Mytilus trossulus]|uniref:uncharacterized protein LOC134690160 n=1 Tax=Mytilus trossulus TaxID=6551 RepID=UPI0030042734